jgi:hypothetical protein
VYFMMEECVHAPSGSGCDGTHGVVARACKTAHDDTNTPGLNGYSKTKVGCDGRTHLLAVHTTLPGSSLAAVLGVSASSQVVFIAAARTLATKGSPDRKNIIPEDVALCVLTFEAPRSAGLSSLGLNAELYAAGNGAGAGGWGLNSDGARCSQELPPKDGSNRPLVVGNRAALAESAAGSAALAGFTAMARCPSLHHGFCHPS